MVAMFGDSPSGSAPSFVNTRCLPSGDQSCLTATSNTKGVTWNKLVPSKLEVKRANPVNCPLDATKLSFLPLGETVGSKQHVPIRCRLLPLRSMLQCASSFVAGSKRSNTIREPSGVKD